jgi:F-type H+-transporting ATPase subunit b
MLIDWFTVGAQALNFLILVWLMKHFLYQPILHAIDTREKKIAAELADADAKRAEAQKDRDEFQHKNEEFDQQRAALLAKATDEANAERQRLIDEARKAADALRTKRQESLRSDAQNLNQAIARRTQEEVFAIARKALTDLATTSLEERIGAVFTRRLREMDAKAKGLLGASLKQAAEPAVVRSAFDLPAEQRATIQNAVNETFSADIHLRFETTPDVVSGIELTANGQKVAWSIAEYLTSLEKGVGELLKQQDKPEPKTAPPPAAPADAQAKPERNAGAAPKPEAAANDKPKPEAESKTAPKPDTKGAPPRAAEAKPEATVEPVAKPSVPAKPVPEVKTESTPPKAEAPSKPETKAAPAAKAESAPAPAAQSEAKVAPKPEAGATPAAEFKAVPVGT